MTTTTEPHALDRYVLDNAWEHARHRLTLLERSFDAGTIRRLRVAEIQPGWRCLEVGAGAGSIARWLCSEVGPSGRVVAVDLDTRFLDQLDEPNLEVRLMDLRTEEFAPGSFDVIHARAVLVHIPQRQRILDGLVAALRPGGVLLIEDPDNFPVSALGSGVNAAMFTAFFDSAAHAGMAKDWARGLPAELHRRGLRDVWAECLAPLFEGGSTQAEFWRVTIAQMRELIVAEGITPERIEEWNHQLSSPGRWFSGIGLVAARGRRGDGMR